MDGYDRPVKYVFPPPILTFLFFILEHRFLDKKTIIKLL